MSDQEQFLKRWSRRKKKLADASKDSTEARDDQEEMSPASRLHEENQEKITAAEPEKEIKTVLDLNTLPPIDSIVAGTDIRPFLAPGVPEELTRAALRRAWTADPAIRDFVGLSENSWDFTKPDSIPGFGPLEMTDALRRVVTEMFEHIGRPGEENTNEDELDRAQPKADAPERVAELGSLEKKTISPSANIVSKERTEQSYIATHHQVPQEKTNNVKPWRGHGSALPK